jgi:dihydroorotase
LTKAINFYLFVLMTDILSIPRFDDLHVHVREGDMAKAVMEQTKKGGVSRIMAMPNLKDPLTTAAKAADYINFINSQNHGLDILFSLYLGHDTTPNEIIEAKKLGISNVKIMPAGVSTNSHFDIKNLEAFYPVLEAMQQNDYIFNIHGEVPSDFSRNICILNAEAKFLPILAEIQKNFPKLRIVLEHMTSAEAVEYVKNNPSENLAATITAHHLDLTIDDVAGKIHNYCKPVAKYPTDCQALRDIVKSGNPKFFLGSDSAPHTRETKETACGCAGVYTAPYLANYLADTFEKINCLDRLQDFTSTFGADYYRIPKQTSTLNLIKKETKIDNQIHGVVPYRAGEVSNWSIQD